MKVFTSYRNIVAFIAYALVVSIPAGTSAQQLNQAYLDYIGKYKDKAIDQMHKYNIPASIILAQGILESDAGRSTLALEGNNHFGIKCHSDWTGRTLYHDDDRSQECFRRYSSAEDSFEDHSVFLASGRRYEFLFSYDVTDYKSWAHGLKRAGYATNPTYATKLINLIETYGLYQYDSGKRHHGATDRAVAGQYEQTDTHQPYISNGLLYVIMQNDDALRDIASEFDISRYKLRKFNEIDRYYVPEAGSVIYLERKKRNASATHMVHVVQSGESLWSISQLYGVRMKSLIRRNRLDAENPLYVGMPLRVR